MKEIRCDKCNKLLAKEENLKGKLEIKCGRCKKIKTVKEGH